MKLTKLSLVAALAVSAVFAGEATVSGDAKVFYGTNDANDGDMFDKANAAGNAAVSLDYTKEIADGISLNAGATGISTLGLESTLVGATWVTHGLADRVWLDVANVTATVGKTTAVIGRQKLETPLAFTETWNIVENTFDAFTFVNGDVDGLTLVASAVTRANGPFEFTNLQGGQTDLGDGIYTVGAVTTLIPQTTAQLWYYDSNTILDKDDKVWVQADIDVAEGLSLGAQYAQSMADDSTVGEDSSVMAAKVGYESGPLSAYAAYSQADDKGTNSFTNYAGYGGSSLYTEAWWNFGYVTSPDAVAVAAGASYDLGAAALGAQYTTVSNDSNPAGEMDELTLTADTSIGAVDATLAFINTSTDADDTNEVQVYLTLPFSL